MRPAPRTTRTARQLHATIVAGGCTLLLASLVACGGDADDPAATGATGPSTVPSPPAETTSPDASETEDGAGVEGGRLVEPQVTGDVATDLNSPWDIAFLPDETALVSQRDAGSIVRVGEGGEVTEVGEVPGVVAGGEGGLLGLAVSPDFGTDQLVYAYHTSSSDNRVVRMTYDGSALGEPEVVLEGIERNTIHNGGRMTFGPDGMLYVGVGDAGDPASSQDTDTLNGKILRLTPDGDVPPDNPFGNLVWSYGHRNVQGLGFDDEGRLWASEFGQETWDELNLIEGGGNYGWPVAEGESDEEGLVDPVVQWSTDEASPSGIAVVDGQVFLAALRGERLWHVPMPGGDTSLEPVAYLNGEYGRLRDVVEAPDGSLWVLTNNTDGRGSPSEGDDRIVRLDRTTG